MKNYEKNQYTGNENGWTEPVTTLGITALDETHANELNSHFRNTGIKYEETSTKPYNFKSKTTANEADHGEPGMVVKDGKFVETENKPEEKLKEAAKENPVGADKETTQQPAKPTDDDAFLKSDGEIKGAEVEKAPGAIEGGPNTPE